MPEVDVLMKGMLSQPGVEGFMVFNDAGKWRNWRTRGARATAIGRGAACTPLRPSWLISPLYHARPLRPAGIPLKWTQSGFVKPGAAANSNPIPASVVHHASLIGDLTAKAKGTCARLLGEADGELQCVRLRTRTSEIIVAPGHDATLVVLQAAHSAAMVPLVALAEAAGTAVAAGAAGEEKKK
jgi:hypothetical protein